LNKPIFVVVNKIDSPSEEVKIGDFFRLGEEEILAVSAEHKRNLEILEQTLQELIPSPGLEEEKSQPLLVALVGRINVGKSSIVNRLYGDEKLIVSEIPGTTRDSTDTLIYRDKKAFSLVDTAGIRKLSRTRDKRERASILKAKKDIKRADVICMIMDAQEFPTRQDTAVAHLSRESGKPMIIVLNKWDLIQKSTRTSEDFKNRCYTKLDFVNYAPLLFVSALTGQRVINILDLAEQVYMNGNKRVGTSQLNNFLTWVNEHHPALSKKKTRMKLKYMTQKRILPPTFVLFTHSRVSLAPTYEKFFTQLLRKKFDFWGTPIRLELRKN
jgi:GTP-binding protein